MYTYVFKYVYFFFKGFMPVNPLGLNPKTYRH